MTISRITIRAALFVALAFVGCSDPDPDVPPDVTPDAGVTDAGADAAANDPPAVHVAYPPPVSMSGENMITLRGTASDADGVAAIRVNGALADTQNDFAEWQVSVPLQPGDNALVVESEDSAGNIAAQAAAVSVVGWANYLRAPVDFVLDTAGDRALVYDSDRAELVAMDLSTARFTVISGAALGTGPLFQSVRAIALHPGTNTVYAVDFGLNALLAVDIATGDRAVVSDAVTGVGFPLLHPIDLELDIASNRAVVLNHFSYDGWRYGVLYTIDLGSGDRALVGADEECIMDTPDVYEQMGECATRADWATSLGYDPLVERAWIFEGPDEDGSIDVVSVDLLTASDTNWPFTQGTVEFIYDPVAIVPDAGNMRVLFAEQVHDAIMAMDLATGFNSYVSGGGVGAGRTLGLPVSMHLDSGRAWVLNAAENARGVFTVDLASGDRSYVQPVVGSGIEIGPDALFVDDGNGRVLGTNGPRVIAIDRATGDRTVLAEIPTPVAIPPGNWAARQWLRDMAVDTAGARAYILHEWEIFENSEDPVIFADGAQILDYDLASDTFVVLAENGLSAGPDFGHLESLVVDVAGARLLVSNRDIDAIMAVDLSSGERSVFADAMTGAGPGLANPVALTMDAGNAPGNGRALVVDNNSDTLFAVDLVSADRTEISGPMVGAGPAIDRVIDMALDADNGRVFIVSDGVVTPSQVLAVELATGDRSVVSENGAQPGPGFQSAQSLALAPGDEILYVSDRQQLAVLAVDARNGTRVLTVR